ncbi:MAG: ATP-dependent DNA helicase [Eubacteriales bacterium]
MNEKYLADIMNTLFETGLLKENERIVGIVDNCLLLERYTGKSFSYRVCDFNNLQLKHLFSRQSRLSVERHSMISEKIDDLGYSKEKPIQFSKTKEERAEELLSYIFTDILPKHGLNLREQQMELSIAMLRGLQKNEICLCEAEVGTGKTHAYILAVVVYNLFTHRKAPTVIATSTIALQKALTEEYIPQISKILIAHKIIESPLTFVIRKGKSHYLCENRCAGFIASAKNKYGNTPMIQTLSEIRDGVYGIDVSNFPKINDYVKRRISVDKCHHDCGFRTFCGYQNFVDKCMTHYYDFHITNHNFLLADLLVRKRGKKALIAPYGQTVIDEAHKLVSAAQTMYGESVSEQDIDRLLFQMSRISDSTQATRKLRKLLDKSKNTLFRSLIERKCEVNLLGPNFLSQVNELIQILKQVSLHYYKADRKVSAVGVIEFTADQLANKLMLMLREDDWVLKMIVEKDSNITLAALPKHLGTLLSADIWEKDVPIILTSGTMSVDGDFSHLKRKVGLYVSGDKISETRKESPFDFNQSALLYLPPYMPYPDVKNEAYNQVLLKEIIKLIRLTHGHTLLLFTSYRQMEQIFLEVEKQVEEYPLFLMGKGKINIIEEFRNSRNGVLFASDSAGEGIDLAGDILSSVIIVKLPFPIPDAMSEYELTLYHEFEDYLTDSVIPTMLIKLRQWFGRGIRRETDSCVFSILDGRAARKYKNAILTALPDMPVTRNINDVGRFILNKKEDSYFE